MFLRLLFCITLIMNIVITIRDSGATTPTALCGNGSISDCKIEYITIGTCNTVTDVFTKTEAQVANDPSHDYPYGLIQFDLSDCPGSPPVTGTMKLSFYHNDMTPIDLTGFIYRKYGPTPNNPTPHWYDFMWDGTTGAVIDGPNGKVTLYFVEGQRGDDDLGNIDGKIVDQGGPARDTSTSVPTMTEWGMIIFMLLAGLGAVYFIRRHKAAQS
jgi:hypothetical protein